MRHATAILGNALARYFVQHYGVRPVVDTLLEHADKAHLLDATAIMPGCGNAGQAIVLTVSMQAAFELGAEPARSAGQLERVEDEALQVLMHALAAIVSDACPEFGPAATAAARPMPCAFLGENDAIAFPAGARCEEVSFSSPIGALRIIVASGDSETDEASLGGRVLAAG